MDQKKASENTRLTEGERRSIQERIDLHQNILREYRNRGYQMVLAQAALVIASARFAVERHDFETVAIGVGLLVITFFLFIWLTRLKSKSDGHRDDALALYARLGAALTRDAEHADSTKRLWGPLIIFPWSILAAAWLWLVLAMVADAAVNKSG